MLGVEMCGLVFLVEHPDHDSEKRRDDRHVSQYSVVCRTAAVDSELPGPAAASRDLGLFETLQDFRVLDSAV
jgi:hypothetical protein